MHLFLLLFPLQHFKRPALQNKQVVVLRMVFRARKVLGTFEKRGPGLDPVLKNFRPVSNLAFVGKAAEKAVIEQLINHCTTHQLLPVNQSSYRKYHSTETALVKVHNDILTSMDNQEVTFLILLGLSAAFDTINHSLLMNIVENDFGITGLAKKWLASYLGNRQQRITIKGCFSDYFHVNSGVPQGSCLGPVLFLLYASGLFNVAS